MVLGQPKPEQDTPWSDLRSLRGVTDIHQLCRYRMDHPQSVHRRL